MFIVLLMLSLRWLLGTKSGQVYNIGRDFFKIYLLKLM